MMGPPMADSHANEWLGLVLDWELAESSCNLKNEGSSTLSYEGEASDYECSNTGLGLYDSTICKYPYNSAIIFNHTTNSSTLSSNSLPLSGNLSESREEDTSFSCHEFSTSPLDATCTASKSHVPSADPPSHHLIDIRSKMVKETCYPGRFSFHNGVDASYDTIIKGSDIEEGLHDTTMMGKLSPYSAGGQRPCVSSNAGNCNIMRPLASVKSKATNTHVLSRRSKAHDSLLEQASDNVHLGQQLLVNRDANLLHLASGMHQKGQEKGPWASSNHFAKCNDDNTRHATMLTTLSSQPQCGKVMTASASLPSAHLDGTAHHQYSKSLTLSFNQHNNSKSKRPHKYHDHDKEVNNSSIEFFFSNPNYSLIKDPELDDMSGITGNDDEESFVLITDNYRMKKVAKVEDDSSARHCLAERKRREKLNKKFDELRTIVGPSLSIKTDKASIIGAAIKILNDKKGLRSPIEPEVSTTKILREVNMSKEGNNFHSQSMLGDDKAILLDGSSSRLQVDFHPCKTKPHIDMSEVFCDLEVEFEISRMGNTTYDLVLHDIKVIAKRQTPQQWHYIINVRTPKRPNIFSDIIITLSNLDLQVIFANSCFSNNNTLSTTSPAMTWFLLKVEVVDDKISISDLDKCEIIHDAIKGCINGIQEKKN